MKQTGEYYKLRDKYDKMYEAIMDEIEMLKLDRKFETSIIMKEGYLKRINNLKSLLKEIES